MWHHISLHTGNIQFNDVVVVSGCGPLGLGMVAAAKQKSPVKLIALDLYDWKVMPCNTVVCFKLET